MAYRFRLAVLWFQRNALPLQLVLFVYMSIFVLVQPASALVRLGNRTLMVQSSQAGDVTTYKVSFYYTTPAVVGSVDMLFCTNPIPYEPCDVPTGLDAGSAVLSDQTGETGYAITTHTSNHMVLSRTPQMTGPGYATYTFTGITNPTDMSHSYGIRLSTYASNDTTGSIINIGTVLTQVTNSVTLETQVPPILIFCVSQIVSDNCVSTDNTNYADLGDLLPSSTLSTSSQFAVGTNASGGYTVTINGTTMAAGTHVIAAAGSPVPSAPGNNQFGINLRANSEPGVGSDPTGDSTNTVISPSYDVPNKFMYHDGDVVASAPNVSLFKKFTVSYIVNSAPDLRAGYYTTTLTYICTGTF